MSVKHIGLVLDGFVTKNAALKLVAIILADHADADGLCWPSYRRIAERANLSERSVARYVHELQELGIIVRVRTGSVIKTDGKARRITNAYRFLTKNLAPQERELSTDDLLVTDTHVYLEVDTGVRSRWTPVSTKPSLNRKKYNHQSLTGVEKSAAYRQAVREPASIGDVFDQLLGGAK